MLRCALESQTWITNTVPQYTSSGSCAILLIAWLQKASVPWFVQHLFEVKPFALLRCMTYLWGLPFSCHFYIAHILFILRRIKLHTEKLFCWRYQNSLIIVSEIIPFTKRAIINRCKGTCAVLYRKTFFIVLERSTREN